MKQKILIAVCLLFTVIANAQFSSLSTNLILTARPSARLSEWAANRATLTLIVTNQQSPKRGKIKVTVKAADGTEVSTTDLTKAITQIFPDGQTVLNAAVVYPLEIQKFSGKYQTSLNKTGKLPSDSYQFCVDIIEEGSVVPLTTQKCASFFVAGLQLPICMMPADNQVLDYAKASTAIIFRWTPIIPRPSSAVIYKLLVFEVLNNQQPMQALRSNQPILDKDIIGQTQFIWQPQGVLGLEDEDDNDNTYSSRDTTIKKGWNGKLKGEKKFIWTIQSLDAKGDAISVDANYEGRSEPKQFSVANKTQDKARKTAKQGHVTLLK
jgi:hypothetical protein